MKITAKYLKDLSKDNRIDAETITAMRDKTGNIKFRKGFFYRMGLNSAMYAEKISDDLTERGLHHEVVDKGEHYVSFKGGDSVAQGSHFYVVLKFLN